MPRIVYVILSDGALTGGQKMAVRHVETLNELGFDAIIHLGATSKSPAGLEHRAPIEQGVSVRSDDIVVVPDDSIEVLETAAKGAQRPVLLSQNLNHTAWTGGLGRIIAHGDRFPAFLCVGPVMRQQLQRLFPSAQVEMARAFADDRRFIPGPKQRRVALMPRKRPLEAAAIRALFPALHPKLAAYRWTFIDGAPEAAVAQALAASEVFLSLSRLDSVGLATLEAMASGCIVAGFRGVGGNQYATPNNGFWVDEDDCFAATDAVAQALDLIAAGGSPLEIMREASAATAKAWSYAVFRLELEAAWLRLAPDLKRADAPT